MYKFLIKNKESLKSSKKKQNGFTLVETLVAISIFTVSILGLMSVLASGVSKTDYAKNKTTATYLAQEGIEYIRNMRDTYFVSSLPWSSFVGILSSTYKCSPSTPCGFSDTVFSTNTFVFPCATHLNQCNLYLNSGKYNSDSAGVSTNFSRTVWVAAVPGSPDEIKIFSNVSWLQGSTTNNVTFSEDLFNWFQS